MGPSRSPVAPSHNPRTARQAFASPISSDHDFETISSDSHVTGSIRVRLAQMDVDRVGVDFDEPGTLRNMTAKLRSWTAGPLE